MNFKNLLNKWKEYLKNIKLPIFVFIVSFLGAFAGSKNTSKAWRRMGIPGISMIYAFIMVCSKLGVLQALWMASIMLMSLFLSMGYGLPSLSKPNEGSALGRFFYYKVVNRNRELTNMLTRGTIGLGIGFSLVSIPTLIGNWLVYGLGILGIVASQAFLSWKNLGFIKKEIHEKEYELLVVDMLNYAIIGGCIFVIITYKLI